jgi:fructose-1,6-bisphosphatase-3
MEPKRVMIGDTDNGQNLKQQISDLTDLLEAYRDGMIMEKK